MTTYVSDIEFQASLLSRDVYYLTWNVSVVSIRMHNIKVLCNLESDKNFGGRDLESDQ